jgi:antitoxin Phd
MELDLNKMIPISKANRNFSEAVKMVDENSMIVIMKQNQPKYVMMTFEKFSEYEDCKK